MTTEILAVYDPAMLEHRPRQWQPDPAAPPLAPGVGQPPAVGSGVWAHPERPDRIGAARDLLEAQPVPGLVWSGAEGAPREALERVHRPYYLDYIESLRGKTEVIDPDTTAVSPRTVEAARVAAGAALRAVEAVVSGEAGGALALVRPPGHHAMPARAMGFCFYNNAAIAAAHARAELGCERVLLVDWDVHHGNGTQEIFYGERGVLFFDTHCQAPFYPGTGALIETGREAGVGATFNVPLPLGCGDAVMLAAYEEILEPVADLYQPDLVLVSAGFDAHALDLAMTLSDGGFAALCAAVQRIAERHAGGRLALVLEGGYHAESIASGVRSCLEVMTGAEPPEIGAPQDGELGLDAVQAAKRFHGLAI
ncbi:MAG: histone deacetylase [Thermoanaerobaculia bacterium]